MKANNTLIASSLTKKGLLDCIIGFYCGTKMEITDDNRIKRLSDSKILEGVIVRKSKNRWRFEMVGAS